jgi:hypothetical protein
MDSDYMTFIFVVMSCCYVLLLCLVVMSCCYVLLLLLVIIKTPFLLVKNTSKNKNLPDTHPSPKASES